ncbi:MAG TPA: DNA-binding domain-containing protein, partial [Polyangiaceae bacterium]|nr:DNA-binding domain-containing protein [Polyangiaceae bacterium]
ARAEVYADAYFYRLLAALGEVFPRLALLVGPVEFHNLVTDYVLACPPATPDLRQLGVRLPEFLRQTALAQRWPLVHEVALVERALAHALDCPEGSLLSEQELSRIPVERWAELRFTFTPATVRLSLCWELPRALELCQSGQAPLALELAPSAVPHGLWIGRRGHVPYFRCPDAAEDAVLSELWRGATLGEACVTRERTGAGLEPAALASALRRWLADGMLAGVSEGPVAAAPPA